MRRVDGFFVSHGLYAVDLSSLRLIETFTRQDEQERHVLTVRAAWFRRRRGTNVAVVGTLRDIQDSLPTSTVEFLEAYTDGRYGGNAHGRWDGVGYWGEEDPVRAAEHLQVLRPMMESFGQVPPGYDGWWTFLAPTTKGGA